MQNYFKQTRVLRADGPQGAIVALSLDSLADAIQQTVRRSLQTHYGQRLQITSVGPKAQLSTPTQIGDALTQWQPLHNGLTFAPSFAPYLETSGVVNGCLNPQHATLLVVHFDRVLFNPVFDANSFHPPLQVTANLTGKSLINAALQKTHYFFTTKLKHGVTQQQRIKLGQTGSIAEHYIGGVFHLSTTPVITSKSESRLWINPGIHFARQGIQKRIEVAIGQAIHQLLGTLGVGDIRKAVVSFLIS